MSVPRHGRAATLGRVYVAGEHPWDIVFHCQPLKLYLLISSVSPLQTCGTITAATGTPPINSKCLMLSGSGFR